MENKVISKEYVDKNYIYKGIIRQKYLEACYEQNEGKNIYENRIKIECYEELLEDK